MILDRFCCFVLIASSTVRFPDVNCHYVRCCARMRRGIPCCTVRAWDSSRRVASIGQCEDQIQADGARAEPIQWKSCLIPLMAWVRTRLFPLICVGSRAECAVGYHAARFVAGMRPGAFNGAARRLELKRTVGAQHGVRKRYEFCAIFSAADGFRRDAHVDIRREAQRQTRPRRRSKLQVVAQAQTDASLPLGRPSLR